MTACGKCGKETADTYALTDYDEATRRWVPIRSCEPCLRPWSQNEREDDHAIAVLLRRELRRKAGIASYEANCARAAERRLAARERAVLDVPDPIDRTVVIPDGIEPDQFTLQPGGDDVTPAELGEPEGDDAPPDEP